MIKSKYLLKSLADEIYDMFYDMKSKVFTLKCVSITTISIEHYIEGVIR